MYGVSIDPMANIYASMKYALANYGSLSRAYNRPGGYARGGIRVGGIRIKRPAPRLRVRRRHQGRRQAHRHRPDRRIRRRGLPQAARGHRVRDRHRHDEGRDRVKNAFKGVKTTLDNTLLARSAHEQALQALAKQRDAIAAKITAANQLAAEATNQANSFAALTSLPNGGNTFDAGGILSGLNVRLGQIKAVRREPQILAKRGLSKVLLQQIITAGPDRAPPTPRPSSTPPRSS
jgi:hypothetical protein